MTPRVLVLYEYSRVGLPHGSAYIRLLQPLTHPSIEGRLYVTPAPVYYGQEAEIVVVDRGWRPDCTPQRAGELVRRVKQQGAKLVYQMDDDLLHLPGADEDAATKREIAALFLAAADGVIVPTPALRARYAAQNSQIVVVPNALDERLLVRRGAPPQPSAGVRLGYMGTHTHDEDVALLLPALQRLAEMTPARLSLEIVGGLARSESVERLRGLPFPVTFVQPPAVEYPQFLPWFSGNVDWDIALAPLLDTPFNRAKSDIKFLDYAALGAPGVYSHLPVYAESVRDGATGLLAANDPERWAAAIARLIAEPALRRELADNARRYLYSERVLARRAVDWAAALERIGQS